MTSAGGILQRFRRILARIGHGEQIGNPTFPNLTFAPVQAKDARGLSGHHGIDVRIGKPTGFACHSEFAGQIAVSRERGIGSQADGNAASAVLPAAVSATA